VSKLALPLIKQKQSRKLAQQKIKSLGRMKIELPKDPTEHQYEDLVAACLMANGYLIEPRITLNDGGVEVFELDVVATPSDERYLDRVLLEAKSGGWGFPDVFKLFGWTKYLGIQSGLLVHKNEPDKRKLETLAKVAAETNVSCKRLTVDKRHTEGLLQPCNGLNEKERRTLLSAAWYGVIAQRIALGKFIDRYKSEKDVNRFDGAKAYRRACERAFFNKRALERVNGLCMAHKETPHITGKFMEELAATNKCETKEILYKLTGNNFEVWLQFIMLLEHKARIAIIKNSLDHLLDPASENEILDFGGFKIKWSDLHLPPGCQQGLEKVQNHPHARKLPYLFQLFVEVFGGFYAPDLNDDLDLLSKATGIPSAEIPECLNLYGVFFPFANGWFHKGKPGLQIMKMIPAIARGAGCFVRHSQFDLKHYSDRYGAIGGRVMGGWHNALLEILHPELKDDDEPPVAT
jgi:hypothetical protein